MKICRILLNSSNFQLKHFRYLSRYKFFHLRLEHNIASEGCLRCQRHVGSNYMWLGLYKKILETILIMFFEFQIFSFLHCFFFWLWPQKHVWGVWKIEQNRVKKRIVDQLIDVKTFPTCFWMILGKSIFWPPFPPLTP